MLAIPSKYRSPWIQLVVFIMLAIGFFMTIGPFGAILVAKTNGVGVDDVQKVLNGEPGAGNVRNIMAGMQVLQFFALFLIPSLLFALWADPKRPLAFTGIKKPWSAKYYLWAVLLVIVSIYASGFIGFINNEIQLPEALARLEQKQNAAVSTLVTSRSLSELLVSILLVGLLPAIGEELFFRGVLQRIFIQLTKNPWAGILITSLFFSAIHLQFAGFLPRMFLGIVLGAIYWYSGSLWPGILFHFIFNSLGVVVAYYKPEQINKPEMIEAGGKYAIFVIGALGLAATIYLLMLMKRKSKTEYAEVYPPKPPDPFA